ncbi:hypothetical protein ACFT7S_02445 [Streptomyces sp. NPDC057136]|uniref:hypothetical protein n=1 Tax=Streptomyces sp. NPDC057136 TaxID=3346029 RepID=UPI0036359360
MRTRSRSRRTAALVLPLALSLTACGADSEGPAESAGPPTSPEVTQPSEPPAPEPESPADFLDLAEKAMAAESAWTFSVKGQEGLTLQGQKSAATYRATVRRGMAPQALQSRGVSTSSKGTTKNEQVYVVDGTAHVKEGGANWRTAPATDPEMQNKIEDPVSVIEEFRAYAQAAGDDVKLAEANGTVELRVGSDKQQLTAVRDRAWVQKAQREFDPTADQLRGAGIPVNDAQLTLSGLEEVLVLDAKTYRVRSHRFAFGFLVPYGGQDITYEQDVRQDNRGTFDGKVELPADAR